MQIALSSMRYRPAHGGVEKYVEDLATSKLGDDFVVVTSDLADHQGFVKLPDIPEELGVVRLSARRNLVARSYPILPGLVKAIGRAQPDIVHVHGMYYPTFDIPLLRIQQPIVANPHAYLRPGIPARLYRRLFPRLIRRAAAVIADSKFEADLIVREFGVPGTKVVIVPPLVAAPERLTRAEPGRIVFVGRLDFAKGSLVLPELAQLLFESGIADFSISIMGASSVAEQHLLNALANATAAVQARVHLVSNPSSGYIRTEVGSSAVFVLPSDYEAFGIAAAEALAAGVPVVCYDTGALGSLGLMDGDVTTVPHGDVELLARAVARVLANAENPSHRTERARRYEQRYGIERWRSSWRDIYDRVL